MSVGSSSTFVCIECAATCWRFRYTVEEVDFLGQPLKVTYEGQRGHSAGCTYKRVSTRLIWDRDNTHREVNTMGMFDKDQAFAPDGRLSEWVDTEYPFILWRAEIIREDFPTSIGSAPMIHLEVSTEEDPSNRAVVSVIGNTIGDKIREQEEGDLPAVVQTRTVPSNNYDSDAYVIHFVAYWDADAGARSEKNPRKVSA